MPVIDAPVHQHTIGGQHYGCHNREAFASYYVAPNRIYQDGGRWYVNSTTNVHHVMSRECRYSSSMTDPKCAGCKHAGSGEAYNEEVRARGK